MSKIESHFIGEMTFHSPISEENSWFSRPLARRTKSIMRLFFDATDASHGSIEWDIPRLDRVEYIGLRFGCNARGQRTLVDYDGVFALPVQAMRLLKRHEIDVTEMRDILKDTDR